MPQLRLRRGQKAILAFNLASIALFTTRFVKSGNSEFLLYVGVILFFMTVIGATEERMKYPDQLLWGLTLWAQMHLAGGSVFIGGIKLYEIILVPLVGSPYFIFRYDQLVHIVGFAAATLMAFHLIGPHLKERSAPRGMSFYLVLVMAGLGFGALNEIIEFAATILVPESGVGGYENTALDLVADLVGALLAATRVRFGPKDPVMKETSPKHFRHR
jgi:putative membrane protein